jgi:hypothetical protein
LPNSKVGLPSLLGFSAFVKAMLQRFKNLVRANLAHRGDPHALEPGANGEPAVQGEANEGANLTGAGVVPNSGQHLGIC